jgi:hypothetical protein
MADVPPGGSVDVSLATTAGEAESFASVGRVGPTAGLQRVELSVASLLGGRAAEGAGGRPRAVRLRFSALSEQTLYSFGFE